MLDDRQIAALVSLAERARASAYAPYSGYRVGATVLANDDRVFFGCNVENASYGLSICAERAAICSAIAAGTKKIKAVIIVTDADPPGMPCGACRQWIQEFASEEVEIIAANTKGKYRRSTLKQLLPEPFVLGE